MSDAYLKKKTSVVVEREENRMGLKGGIG